jgi:ribonuclease HII
MLMKTFIEDNRCFSVICGLDEAGRGPLAGPVYAAAVILPLDVDIDGLDDSKKLSHKKREIIFDKIIDVALNYGIGIATVEEIDKFNILNATFLAFKRAISKIDIKFEIALVDGNKPLEGNFYSKAVVRGDEKYASIAAASIIAKVSRDRYMVNLGKQYPQYQFCRHKGYPTKLHYSLIQQFGISCLHRKSFLKNLESKYE